MQTTGISPYLEFPIHYTVMFKFYKNNLLSLHHLTAEDVEEKGENKLDVFSI